MNIAESLYFMTSDGVKLHYLQLGAGDPLVMLPGGGMSANVFKEQMLHLSSTYQVISLDKRGHGKSDKVAFGYRISRFAQDLHELLSSLNLYDVNLLCHSLGAGVFYNYLDLFGPQRLKKIIVVDEPTVLLINPKWSDAEKEQYGAIYEIDKLYELINNLTEADTSKIKQQIIDSMTTRYATERQKQFILQCMTLPGLLASKLYFNNICQDFRDVLTKMTMPVLFITGRASLHPWQSHQWMHKQVATSSLEIFEEDEGGNHFMFVENPKKFNQIVTSFLQHEN